MREPAVMSTIPRSEPEARDAPAAPLGGPWPVQPLLHLDTLWIQVAGTLCNLECVHCFVPSGPGIDRHALMPRPEVRRLLNEGLALGVREIYFTGGEPFIHPEILAILGDTLDLAPTTVLTNGTLFTTRTVTMLRELNDHARYALEIRVSLDGATAEAHDRVRGAGSFARAMDGLSRLAAAGLLPIVTVTDPGDDSDALRERYLALLRGAGLARPRLKVLPLFRLGREAERHGGYHAAETLAGIGDAFDPTRLQCGSCRAVTSRGVFVCPLLVDEPAARMGDRLEQALGPYTLRHGACLTCHVTGMTCANG
jgi:uncharacterized Fe-S cluster-containing radical SAM superfamily protein